MPKTSKRRRTTSTASSPQRRTTLSPTKRTHSKQSSNNNDGVDNIPRLYPIISPSSLTREEIYKLKRIRSCIEKYYNSEENDCKNCSILWELRSFAFSPGGFLSPEIRQEVWPLLLNLKKNEKDWTYDSKNHRSVSSNDNQSINRSEANVIRQDVGRTQWRLDKFLTEPQIIQEFTQDIHLSQVLSKDVMNVMSIPPKASERVLLGVICKAISDSSSTGNKIHYYQGFHDIASLILLQTQSPILTSRILTQLGQFYLVDYMSQSFHSTMVILQIGTWVLLSEGESEGDDNASELFEHLLGSGPGIQLMILSWVIGWFTHEDFGACTTTGKGGTRENNIIVATRILDVCMASHPCMSLYLSIALLIHYKTFILEETGSNVNGNDISLLQQVVQSLPQKIVHDNQVEKWIQKALWLMKAIPPDTLIERAMECQEDDAVLFEAVKASSSISILNPSFSQSYENTSRIHNEATIRQVQSYQKAMVAIGKYKEFKKIMKKKKKLRKKLFIRVLLLLIIMVIVSIVLFVQFHQKQKLLLEEGHHQPRVNTNNVMKRDAMTKATAASIGQQTVSTTTSQSNTNSNSYSFSPLNHYNHNNNNSDSSSASNTMNSMSVTSPEKKKKKPTKSKQEIQQTTIDQIKQQNINDNSKRNSDNNNGSSAKDKTQKSERDAIMTPLSSSTTTTNTNSGGVLSLAIAMVKSNHDNNNDKINQQTQKEEQQHSNVHKTQQEEEGKVSTKSKNKDTNKKNIENTYTDKNDKTLREKPTHHTSNIPSSPSIAIQMLPILPTVPSTGDGIIKTDPIGDGIKSMFLSLRHELRNDAEIVFL